MKCKAVEITMLLCCFLEELRSFLEELNNLLEVRMRFSKLPLRIRLRWSSAGRAQVECWLLIHDANIQNPSCSVATIFSHYTLLYAILRHFLPKLSFGAKLTCLNQNNCNGCCRGLPRFALLLFSSRWGFCLRWLLWSERKDCPWRYGGLPAKETKSAAARAEVDSSSDVKIMQISLLIVFYFIERINE